MYRQHTLLALLLNLLMACSAYAQVSLPASQIAPVPAAYAAPAGPVVTLGSTPTLNLEPALRFFLDTTGQLTQDQLEALPEASFARVQTGAPFLIGNGALWLQFDAVNNRPQTHWRLTVPLPGVDDVSLFYRGQDGQWAVQQAGDRRAISNWTQPGRYPVFSLSHELGKQVRYFVKIEHARVPYSVMPRIVTDAQLLETELLSHILLGAYFGLAALVVVLALANTVAYRDAGFGTYALYIALFTLAQGMFTSVAGLYWWPEWPALNRGLSFTFVLAVAAATWFVRTVVMPKRFSPALDKAVLTLVVVLPLAGLMDMLLQTQLTFSVYNWLLSLDLFLLFTVVFVAVYSGDKHSRWVAYGFLPILAASMLPLLRNYGAIASSFWTEYAMLIGSAIEVPILFYGLYRRMAQDRSINLRASSVRYSDPLTGVYTAKIVRQKLLQVLDATPRYHQPFALLAIELTNYADLLKKYNRDTADRALVMAAARIRSVARSADTVARLGETQFALLMEGPITANDANDVATKILAAGLRATNELPEREPLRFNIALSHYNEPRAPFPARAESALTQLLAAVKEMNDGSGKAIRFLKL
jgi:diguanylate cyclase (GGDEF)-like protein